MILVSRPRKHRNMTTPSRDPLLALIDSVYLAVMRRLRAGDR